MANVSRRGPQAWIAAALILGSIACGAVARAGDAGLGNLLLNPHFHDDVLSWDLSAGASLLWTDITDESSCANSGIALAVSEDDGGADVAEISQCIPIEPPGVLYTGVRHRGYGLFRWQVSQYATADCTGDSLTSAHVELAQSFDDWQDKNLAPSIVPGAASVGLFARATDTEPHGLQLDEAYVFLRWPIFSDDFDGNDAGETHPCRWSSSVP